MKHALFADLELALEPLLDHVLDALAELWYGDLRHYLVGKSEHEEHPGGIFPDTALAEVEHGILVELAGGGAVRAFDIVVVDLEERLRVYPGGIGKQYVPVRLPGIGIHGVAPHQHVSVEDPAGIFIEDPLKGLTART